MNNLFHVKPSRSGKRFGTLSVSMGAMLLLAEVHKFTSVDGWGTCGDQLCAVGQMGGLAKVGAEVATVQSPPMPGGSDTSDAARVRLRAAPAPEFNRLGGRINRYVEQGGRTGVCGGGQGG